MASISSPGLGSGLDVNSIVTQLMAAEQRPLTRLQVKETAVQNQISTLGTLKSSISAFQDSVKALNDANTYNGVRATSTDATSATVSADTTAGAGSYALEVTTLARAQKLASSPFSSTNQVVGSGSLTFQFGTYDSNADTFSANPDRGAKTVTIPPGQNTLAGVRDAINGANIGVQATLINDGAGPKLLISSTVTGTANSLRITSSDDGATAGASLTQFNYDPTAPAGNVGEVQAARDAVFKIDGISVKRSTNTVTDVVEGLTVNLLKEGSTTTLNVNKDTSAIKSAIDAVVKGYNKLNATLNAATVNNPGTNQDGPLQGDSTISVLQSQMRTTITSMVAGIANGSRSAADLGIAFQRDGTLQFDAARFDKALASSGVSDVKRVFATLGTPSDTRIDFTSALATTPTGAYTVTISQPATQGKMVGSQAANLSIVAGVNDSFTLSANGVTTSVKLTAGTYTADSLAAEVQSKVNGSSNFSNAGISVAVSQNAGVLTLTSSSYGSTSVVSTAAGNAAADLLGTPTSTDGVNVQSLINGNAPESTGQDIITADGLRLKLRATAAGDYGQVQVTRGLAAKLDDLLTKALDTGGLIAARVTGLQAQAKTYQAQQVQVQTRLDSIEARYRKQFSTLDATIANLNRTSSYLQQQLSSLSSSR